LDQEIDKSQPLLFVHGFGQQLAIAVVVKSSVLFTHLAAPARNVRSKLFINLPTAAIAWLPLCTAEIPGAPVPTEAE